MDAGKLEAVLGEAFFPSRPIVARKWRCAKCEMALFYSVPDTVFLTADGAAACAGTQALHEGMVWTETK
jgi:hypothetical protein